jgi:hypothetical protein
MAGAGRTVWQFAVAALALLVATAASAADIVTKASARSIFMPAVDGINGKFDAFGGEVNRHGYYGGTGSLSVPVSQQFGVQFDGLAGSYRNAFLGAIGAHAFWRNPSQGLFGLYGSYAHLDRLGGIDVGRFGAEGALYVGRATLEGIVGVEFGNSGSARFGTTVETIDIKTRFYDRISLAYYVTDDLKLAIGHRYTGGKNALMLSGEYGFAIPGTIHMGAAFVEGRIGSGDTSSVWAGLRMYVGQKSKSLIRRHREDDPVNVLADEASTFGNSSGTSTQTGGVTGCPPGFVLVGGACIGI